MVDDLSRQETAEQVSGWIRDPKIKARFVEMLLSWHSTVASGEPLPIPFPGDRDLSLEESYAVLSAIYDNEPLGAKLGQWSDPRKDEAELEGGKEPERAMTDVEYEAFRAGYHYDHLKIEAEGCEASYRLTQILSEVAKDISKIQAGQVENDSTADRSDETPVEDEFVFTESGGTFFIKGFGASGYFKKIKGFEYILVLIRSPSEGVPMQLLRSMEADSRKVADTYSKQPILDKEKINGLKSRLATAQTDLEKAKTENDTMEIAICQQEIEEVCCQIRDATGFGGKARDLNNPLDKVRPGIHSALKRAYEKLREATPPMKQLADHFESSISSELGCFVYKPVGQPPSWSFDSPGKK